MSVLYVKGATLYICGHLNYTTILSSVQTNGAPTVVHTRVKSVFPLIHQTVNFSFHPPFLLCPWSTVNYRNFPFFFYLSSLPRLCRYAWDLLSSASRRRSGDPLYLCFLFFFKKNYFFETNLPLRVGSSVVYVLTGTVGFVFILFFVLAD